jgi:hypothetical protein
MSLMKMLLARATPESRERNAQLRFACARAYESCGEMAQFVDCAVGGKRGLLNVLNGCLVRTGPDQNCLLLSWQSPGAHADAAPGQECLLESEDQMQRFVWAMRAQADSLAPGALATREWPMSERDNLGRAA